MATAFQIVDQPKADLAGMIREERRLWGAMGIIDARQRIAQADGAQDVLDGLKREYTLASSVWFQMHEKVKTVVAGEIAATWGISPADLKSFL